MGCWAYGPGCKSDCRVCSRLRTQNDLPPPATIDKYAGYCARVRIPETTRLVNIATQHDVIFAQKSAEVKIAAPKQRVFSMSNDDIFAFKHAPEPTTFVHSVSSLSVAVTRLHQFIAIVKILDDAPWANIRFIENQKMMKRFIATHLFAIVGVAESKAHKSELYAIIDAYEDFSNLKHICWITNRQNGKTTTLARFHAAIMLCSPLGGDLLYIYATNKNKASDLLNAGKNYLVWLKSDAVASARLAALGFTVPKFTRENQSEFGIQSIFNPSVVNITKGRPKTVNSCRGDAVPILWVDEMAFVSPDWWYRFLFPMAAVEDRVILMATTPALNGTFFAVLMGLMQEAVKNDNNLFTIINHSIICDKCVEAGQHTKCRHKLQWLPAWKSVFGINNMKDMVPGQRMDDYYKEVFGLVKNDDAYYLPSSLVEATFNLKNARRITNIATSPRVYITVDPPAKNSSHSGFNAGLFNEDGVWFTIGTAQLQTKESEIVQLNTIVSRFVTRVLTRFVDVTKTRMSSIEVVPIVECNNNEYISNEIVNTIKRTAMLSLKTKYFMPFTKDVFKDTIESNLGVWTNNAEKHGMLSQMIDMLTQKRIVIWNQCVTMGDVASARSEVVQIKTALEDLSIGLTQFKETKDGPSGKTATNEDDCAMAQLMGPFWGTKLLINELSTGPDAWRQKKMPAQRQQKRDRIDRVR